MLDQISNKEKDKKSKTFSSNVVFKIEESAASGQLPVYPHKTAFDRKAEEMKIFLERNPVPKKFLKDVDRPDF